MTSPLTLERIVNKLPDKFNPEQASNLDAVLQFRLTDADSFYIQIQQQACYSQFGEHDDPSLVLHLDEATLMRVISGEQDGMSAYLKGHLRAEGNVMLATRLGKLFSR
ncbi:SCP2 sterol-binding domain-containing protein [Marinobacterium weihaiense]|uniref:SCP2 sterol-binding domain-containing protein n=1 Tax=Marinobacterium weihaiense TaxID=2851016 RepID=A0ABS6M7B4_9GAMM|nr:SCP2 sterol-binding domain-containing protein [Marinobacterium weihaiense]MBV0932174.1 SCP2 sterol-binding domain-containing protein [Marinobacterium weihaiense]